MPGVVKHDRHVPKAQPIERVLADLGKRRAAAIEARRRVGAELAEAVPRAHTAGISVIDIARLTGLSRQGVYDLLGDHGT